MVCVIRQKMYEIIKFVGCCDTPCILIRVKDWFDRKFFSHKRRYCQRSQLPRSLFFNKFSIARSTHTLHLCSFSSEYEFIRGEFQGGGHLSVTFTHLRL